MGVQNVILDVVAALLQLRQLLVVVDLAADLWVLWQQALKV